ncbi:ChrR family anti-sigma-E factor [Pseudooceanicola nanhaiensis]|uniref:ChrR family anti-sigma-E factor n=1 Tax=Pseudooceanicola nanhaiensis TaxID=375761 RepID=UPI001CD486A4|nr:ChrR family anti-sigma-E factor [Pseudooceanicola nanhaiensis]MCA0921229.1 ChrR family anti-sigma-E factor [Pseudooceanicola nanhaiensis]
MGIKHHLTESLLMGYAAGTLPEAFSLVVATHVSMCDDCRARLEALESLGGAVLEAQGMEAAGISAMEAGALDAVLARLDATPEPRLARAASGTLPGPLRDYVGGDVEAVRWRPVGMGVKQAILPTSKSASARLLYIPAGAAMPDHGHRGMELTLVLQGAFTDEDDRFGPGDVEVADEELNHTPVADIGEDCICLAATDAPLRFNAWLPRLAQPFFKI